MKTINVDSRSVPATARSKNYQTALATTTASGGGATTPSTMTPTGGAADTAKVAQNLAEDSTDWTKILRKDIDERTENALSIGKNLTVDGRAILNDVVANTGTFGGLLKAAAATITGALSASTVSATTMNANTFIGKLQGNAATATKLQTPRTIWGQSFDGSGNVSGRLSLDDSSVYWKEPYLGDQFAIVPSFTNTDDSNILCFQSAVGDHGTTPSLSTKMVITGKSGNVGIGTTTPAYKLDVNGNMRVTSDLYADATVGTRNFASHTTGWRADANGNADFGGLLKAASATITGALLASTVNATTMNANTFIGDLIGNANTATQLKNTHKIFGNDFNGLNDVSGTVYASIGLRSRNICIETESDGSAGARGSEINNYTSDLFLQYATQNNLLCCQGGGLVGISTTNPQYKLDVNGNMRVTSDLYADATVGTRNFASHTTGWRADANGNADFRNIYADELRVQAFTADISQALAGSDYLTKSVSKLSANFVVPSVNSIVRIIVDDIEGMPATQCFTNGDYIRFRAFNRTSGLTIANVWGTVSLDTSFGTNGFSNGTQAYTFTCKQTTGAGLTVFKGSEVLDYGTSGSGLIARTTLDTMGSPYEQIATWKNDPSVSTNYTVHARLGNLNGIANCNGYGLYTDNGFFTKNVVIGDLTKNANFLSFDGVNGLQIKLGGTSVATTADVSTAAASGNAAYAQVNWKTIDADTDLNSMTTTGKYLMKGTLTNSATSQGAYLVVENATSDRITQTIWHDTDATNKYTRQLHNTTWGSWVKIANNQDVSNSLSTANSNAQGYASTAQSNAISTASSDATTKANTAYTNAVSYTNTQITATNNSITAAVNAIQIGGRNLARLSKGDFTYNLTDTFNYTSTMCTVYWVGYKSANIVMSGDVEYSNIVFTGTGKHFFRIQGAQDVGVWSAGIYFPLDDKISEGNGKFHFAYVSVQSTILNNNYWYFGFHSDYITGTITFRNLKVEYGTKETSWTPAPEDVDASIAKAQSSAISTAASNAASLYVTQTAYSSQVTILQNSISSKVSQTDFNALGQRVGTAESNITQNAHDITSKVSSTDYTGNNIASLINQTATTVTINASKINLVGAVTFKSFTTDVQNTINGKADNAAHGNFTYINGSSIYTGTLNANQVTAGYISADRIASNSLDASKIVANSITSTQIDANSVSASIATVISLDASRITTGKLSADRIDAVSVVTKGLVAQTIDAQSATISNLNVVNATVNGYFHAEYSGGAFVRMGMPASPKMLDIRADGLTGIDIDVDGDNSTGLSIIANGLNNSAALNIYGSNYLITRQFSVPEGTWINGLSLCRVTITSGGDLGSGSLRWYHDGGYFMPNFIVSEASSNISVYIPADMADGAVLIFRAAGGGTINVSSRNLSDKFQWGSHWNNDYKPYALVAPGSLIIMVYDKASHTWYSHGIS